MGREFELKFRADARVLAAIEEKYAPFSQISMETTYYDTPDAALSAHRWTLRRRFENGISVCTVKTPGSNGSRGEWETVCGDILAAVPALVAAGAPGELEALTAAGVKATCGARFTRQAARLELEEGAVELALDKGFLLGCNRELPFMEVEVELKSGSEEAAARFAEKLAAEFALIPEPKSKLQRARELIDSGEKENGKF